MAAQHRLKLFFLLLFTTYLVSAVSSSPCTRSEDCQDKNRICNVGACSCMPGWVDWKWECHPLVGLGEACITSAQCKSETTPSHVCNPINHKCSCERGFIPTVDGLEGLICIGLKEKTEDHQDYIAHISPNLSQAMNHRQIQPISSNDPPSSKLTWTLLCILILGSGAAVLVLALYLRTLKEKRVSQARVQSLLRIVAEQNDIHPSLTSLTSFTSHLDVEDEVYQNYHKREESLADPDWRNSLTFLTDQPPKYEDLLK